MGMGADGADYCAVEWGGEAVAAMTVDERLTLCNLSTDFGAKTGIIALQLHKGPPMNVWFKDIKIKKL